MKTTFTHENFEADKPFIILTKIKVKDDEFLNTQKLLDKTDKAFETDELRILYHTFDKGPEFFLVG